VHTIIAFFSQTPILQTCVLQGFAIFNALHKKCVCVRATFLDCFSLPSNLCCTSVLLSQLYWTLTDCCHLLPCKYCPFNCWASPNPLANTVHHLQGVPKPPCKYCPSSAGRPKPPEMVLDLSKRVYGGRACLFLHHEWRCPGGADH